MQKWDNAVQGFAVGVGAASAGAAGMILVKFGASQEAILSLLGALIGAAATVAGAAWLSDCNARVEQQQEIQMLIDEYEKIHALASEALKFCGYENPTTGPSYVVLFPILKSSWECETITTEALATAKRLTFRQRSRLRQVLSSITGFSEYYEKYKFAPHEYGNGGRKYPRWYVVQIFNATDHALRQLRNLPHKDVDEIKSGSGITDVQ